MASLPDPACMCLSQPQERAAEAMQWMKVCNPHLKDDQLDLYRLAWQRGYEHGQGEEFDRLRQADTLAGKGGA